MNSKILKLTKIWSGKEIIKSVKLFTLTIPKQLKI